MVMCFNQPMSIRELRLDQPLLTQYPSTVALVCQPHIWVTLDNSIMDNMQGETLYFPIIYVLKS